ncbi:hypothetical protein [Streptomyces sp. NPDC050848]|uniref:hypothetical protein n=1 Tax=Streptomyces sp. NPDC050848 TaxID=3155791 RepID=UPI0033CF5681
MPLRTSAYGENLVVTVRVTIVAEQARGAVEIAPRDGVAVALRADSVMLTDPVIRGRDEELPVVDGPCGQLAMDGCEVSGAAWTAVLARGSGRSRFMTAGVSNPAGTGVVATSPEECSVASSVLEHLGTTGIVADERRQGHGHGGRRPSPALGVRRHGQPEVEHAQLTHRGGS